MLIALDAREAGLVPRITPYVHAKFRVDPRRGWNCHAQGSCIRALKTQSEIDQFGVGVFDFECKRVSLGSWIEYLSARRWGWQRRWGRGRRWRWCAKRRTWILCRSVLP